MNEKVFECFGLNYLSKREGLDKAKITDVTDFLRCDLSILSEREIVDTLIGRELFSEYEKELIKVWAIVLKSKKLFEIAEGSALTDIEFTTKLKEFSCSECFIQSVPQIAWKYAAIDVNNIYVAGIEGFYEEIAMKMARSNSLTVELIEKFDSGCVDWNYKDVSGRSLLVYVCRNNLNMDLLTCLLDKEIDINSTNCYGDTVFMELCCNSEVTLDMLKLFFDRGVSFEDACEHIAFVNLCGNKSITLDMMRLFFDRGVGTDRRDEIGRTAFTRLCSNESVTIDMLRLFLDIGANVDLQDSDDDIAFVRLCHNKAITLDMLKIFFDRGVDIDIEDYYGGTAFMHLCCNESVTLDMLKLFFDRGVNIEKKDCNCATAFEFLCSNESIRLDMVKLFLENGASLDILSDTHLVALDYYIGCGRENEGILKLLGQS